MTARRGALPRFIEGERQSMSEFCAPTGKLDLSAVSDLHARLLNDAGKDIVLDLSDVTQIGALCMQTCVAAARHARATGATFEVCNASDDVQTQLAWMGLSPETIAEGAV